MPRTPRRGEIWSVFLPGQPYDPHQPRPALVISTNARNRRGDDVMVVPAFSRGAPRATHIFLPAGGGGLHHDSVLFCEELTTIHRDFLAAGPFGPPVPERVLLQVLSAVRAALGDLPTRRP